MTDIEKGNESGTLHKIIPVLLLDVHAWISNDTQTFLIFTTMIVII